MQIDTQPIFKKAYRAWYDGNAICILLILFLVAVCGFSLVGIDLALTTPAYRSHVGLPVTLLVLSVWVILSVGTRLFLRFLRRSDRR